MREDTDANFLPQHGDTGTLRRTENTQFSVGSVSELRGAR